MADSSGPVAPGDTIEGRYRIVKRLDEGGMGTVFLAEHVLIKRKLAIKVLRPELATDAEVVERFMNEARAAGTLGHPNIVESTDMGFTNGIPYIVFEFLEGTLLVDEIYRLHGLTVRRALKIAHQIASALHAAHQAGIVHRDLKSENVFLITKDERPDHVKVLDFGISRFLEVETDSNKRNTVMGTPEFMAPEQITSPEKVDRRADIYALGVIIYEMLSARRPFRNDDDPQAVLHQVVHDKPPPLGKGDAPPGLSEMIVDKLLAKDPDDRYPTMKELQSALEAFFNVVRPSHSLTPIAIPEEVVKAALAQPPTTPAPAAKPVSEAPVTPTPTAAAQALPVAPAPRSKLGLIFGGVAALAVVAGVAIKLTSGGHAAPSPGTPAPPSGASAGAIQADADKLATAIDNANRAASMRAEGIASSPVVRAGIETDAATIRDLANGEHVFAPKPGEIIEVLQERGGKTSMLLRLPDGPQLPAPPAGQALVESDGQELVVITGSPVTTQGGAHGGMIVIASPVELAPIKAALAEHTAGATLVGLAKPLELVPAAGKAAPAQVRVTAPSGVKAPELTLRAIPR